MMQYQFKGDIDHALLQKELTAAIGTQEIAGWYLNGSQGEVTFITTKDNTPDPTAVIEAHVAAAPVREHNKAIDVAIKAIEDETGVVRVVREGLLRTAEFVAEMQSAQLTAAGTPATVEELLLQNIGYQRALAVDNQISLLRSQRK